MLGASLLHASGVQGEQRPGLLDPTLQELPIPMIYFITYYYLIIIIVVYCNVNNLWLRYG